MPLDPYQQKVCLDFVRSMLVIQGKPIIRLVVHNAEKGRTDYRSWGIEEI